jgi:hypothetical protein
MKTLGIRVLCPIAVFLCAATSANAASVTGDAFDVSAVIEGTAFGPFTGVAGGANDDVLAGPDEFELRVNWVDDDSFDLMFISFFGFDLTNPSFTLSDLNFQSAGQPRDVIGVAFNRAASNVDEFEAGPSLDTPSLSFTPNSLTATFALFSRELAADGPRLRFDVTTVPEPSTKLLILTGLGALGLIGRRGANRRA